MSITPNPSAEVYTQGFGSSSLSSLGLIPVISTAAPASSNITGSAGPYKIGQVWIVPSSNSVYMLTSISSSGGIVTATWTVL